MARIIQPEMPVMGGEAENANEGTSEHKSGFEVVERVRLSIHEEDETLERDSKYERFRLREGPNLLNFEEEYERFKVQDENGDERYRYKFTASILTKDDPREGETVSIFLPPGAAREVRAKMREYAGEPLVIERLGSGPSTRYIVRSLTEWKKQTSILEYDTSSGQGA